MSSLKENILKAYAEIGTVRGVARYLGSDVKTVRKHLRRNDVATNVRHDTNDKKEPQEQDVITSEYSAKSGYVSTRSMNIRTLEDALKAAKVDLSVWKVVRHRISYSEVTISGKRSSTQKDTTYTNCHVQVWVEPIVVEPQVTALEELIKEIPAYKHKSRIIKRAPETGVALELALYDAHIGKLAWDKETLQGDYDSKLAVQIMLKAAEKSLEYAVDFHPEKIYYVLGQDLMHVENIWGKTPLGGNVLDMDTRLPKIYKAAWEATIKILYMCADVAPVEVLCVPGNHDMHFTMTIGEIVNQHFRNTDRVQVDNSPATRKARLWGDLLVGFTHDASGRLEPATVNMLAQFWPELWGKSKFREWHVGHKHKKQEVKYMPTLTKGGVIIRQIPTLSRIDNWHFEEGFVDAVPAGESFIWSKKNGVFAHHTAYIGA